MWWDADVRGAPALFAGFRSRMMQLLQEVRAAAANWMGASTGHGMQPHQALCEMLRCPNGARVL